MGVLGFAGSFAATAMMQSLLGRASRAQADTADTMGIPGFQAETTPSPGVVSGIFVGGSVLFELPFHLLIYFAQRQYETILYIIYTHIYIYIYI